MGRVLIITATILFLLVPVLSKADSWELPKVKDYFSEDSSFMLRVTPTFIPEKYYEYRYNTRKRKKRYSAQDTTVTLCYARLYQIKSQGDTIEVWNRKLINKIAPVYALVSNDGQRVITLDNWHSMGYGLDVLAVYNENGTNWMTFLSSQLMIMSFRFRQYGGIAELRF